MITFKIYEKDASDAYKELGTVLHESTLHRIAAHMKKSELSQLFVETYKDGQPVQRTPKGKFCIAPLATWE